MRTSVRYGVGSPGFGDCWMRSGITPAVCHAASFSSPSSRTAADASVKPANREEEADWARTADRSAIKPSSAKMRALRCNSAEMISSERGAKS